MSNIFHDKFLRFFVYLYFVVLTILIILSVFVPKGADVVYINGHNNPFLDWFMPKATYLGDGIIIVPMLLTLLFVRFGSVLSALATGVGTGIVSSIFKQLIFPSAPRPRRFLEADLLHFVPGVDVHAHHSFPSGHTATAFAVCVLIALMVRSRQLTVVLLLVAMLVGYSRIYLLQHFLMDVTAGAVMGTVVAFVAYHFFENLKNPSWLNSRLQIIKRPGGIGRLQVR